MPNDGRKTTRWLDVEISVMQKILDSIGGNGHGILFTQSCKDLGIPTCICNRLEGTFKSDTSDPKSTIFLNGEAVEETKGIRTLDILKDMVGQLPIPVEKVASAHNYLGRGRVASELTALLRDALEMKTETLAAMTKGGA